MITYSSLEIKVEIIILIVSKTKPIELIPCISTIYLVSKLLSN
jgi:hypothetical protein